MRQGICRRGGAPIALAAGLMISAPVSAQVYYIYPSSPAPRAIYQLPPHEVEAVVRSLRLRPAGPIRAQGPVYLAPAVGQEGSLVHVLIDRRNGRVVEIVRVGRGAPPIARAYPGVDGPPSGRDYLDGSVRRAPPGQVLYGSRPGQVPSEEFFSEEDGGGRDGIEATELPPPGGPAGPRVITREQARGAPPRTASTPTVDPMLGVPPEFRRNANRGAEPERKIAARPSEPSVQSVPLPPKRPTEAPSVAQRSEPAPAPAVRPEPKSAPAKPQSENWPPVQPLE